MLGSLDRVIVAQVKEGFEQKCISLLEWACRTLKANKTMNGDWGEENISANIYTYLRDSQQAVDANIFVESEHFLYSQNILDNRELAKSAPRIDFLFQHNWSGRRIYYYIEAKKLVQFDFTKVGCQSPIKASSVRKRYIETGIDHFLSERYPMGCMLGYVLNGTIDGVVKGINSLLTKARRNDEVLQYFTGVEPWMNYISNHPSVSAPVKHFFFNFN